MTHRAELLELRDKARRAGRNVSLFITEAGEIDAVFYADHRARGGRFRAGCILSPLSFAEAERAAPHSWEIPSVKTKSGAWVLSSAPNPRH